MGKAIGDSAGYLRSTMVDPGGLALTSRYEVDARGNVTATVDPRGVRSTRTVNELDWPVETMAAASPSGDGAPALNLKTTWVYDANGNLAEERLPVGTGGSQAATVFSHGMLDELLSVSHTVPSSGQQVTRSFGYDEDYNVVQRSDPVGTVTEIDYDVRDLPVAVRRGVGMPEMASESFTYDADGRRTSWRDGRGELWASTFDGYGRPAASVDPLGNRTETIYPDASSDPGVSYQAVEVLRESPSGDLMARSRSAFDPLGRTATSTRFLWEGSDVGSARALTTSYGYDGAGHLTAVTDPMARSTSWSYDMVGRRTGVTDAAGNQVSWILDRGGNPVRTERFETMPSGGVAMIPSTADFDALGRPTAVRDALGNETKDLLRRPWQPDGQGRPRGQPDLA